MGSTEEPGTETRASHPQGAASWRAEPGAGRYPQVTSDGLRLAVHRDRSCVLLRGGLLPETFLQLVGDSQAPNTDVLRSTLPVIAPFTLQTTVKHPA